MDPDESIKGLWKRQSLNWTQKDGQNQYVEITEGPDPSPLGKDKSWVGGIPHPKAENVHGTATNWLWTESVILVSETKIKPILGPHNAERTGVGQGELNSLELKKKKKKKEFC